MTPNPARQQNNAGSRVHGDEPITHASDQKDQQLAAERPTEFTNEIGEIICDRIIDDETLRSICSDAGMPERPTSAFGSPTMPRSGAGSPASARSRPTAFSMRLSSSSMR